VFSKHSIYLFSLVTLSLLLTSCSGNQQIEKLFTPDSNLQTPTPTVTPTVTPKPELTLPPEFPSSIPIYPETKLKAIAPNLTPNQGTITWESSEPSNLIQGYYEQELPLKKWEISPESKENLIVAHNDNLDLEITLKPSASLTEIIVNYQSKTAINPQQTPSQPVGDTTITDLGKIPPTYRKYVEDLAKLNIFSDSDLGENRTFQPDKIITRGEYARWLFLAHNRLYSDTPSQQINLASPNTQPAFTDVSSDRPDFPMIQGLAEAGIIPSKLTGDETLFRPDAPLTRADLIGWKVPLDYRKSLPSASIEDIQSTWGFQDATEIDAKTRQALYVDFENDKTNVSRAFGYTILFQPNKPVTRAEAATVLWSFGYQNQTRNASQSPQTE
jgi:hypothetical protein